MPMEAVAVRLRASVEGVAVVVSVVTLPAEDLPLRCACAAYPETAASARASRHPGAPNQPRQPAEEKSGAGRRPIWAREVPIAQAGGGLCGAMAFAPTAQSLAARGELAAQQS